MFCIHWTWDALLYKTLMFWHFDLEMFIHSLQEITISCSKRTVISDVKMYCTNMEFCIWQTSFFLCCTCDGILKTVWGNGFGVLLFPYVCVYERETDRQQGEREYVISETQPSQYWDRDLSAHLRQSINSLKCVNAINPLDKTYDSINTIIIKSLRCFFSSPLY